ncbi:PAS domain S-box protein [Candidatus Borrarchaeum sp.]|uniref:PAS domain S-box protein n=1 Tax=Candidatus Borrarchaeum sp. TaxID=2846742 RepID=UPI0025805E4F|nr:PAS domain S-box protein [Candidatus Borrarchaeum sp.]
MGLPLRVLIVEDSEDDATLLVRELRRGGYEPTFVRVDTPDAMKSALTNQIWDIVISDYVMPKFSGIAALKLFQESGIDLPFIIMSGKIGEDFAVEAMKAGAHDYIVKGKTARLIPAIQREMREAEVRRGRKRAEVALEEIARRFRRTFEAIPDPAYLWGRQSDWRIILTQANKAAYDLTEGEIGDFIGTEVEKLYHGMVEKLNLAMDTGKTQREEMFLKLPTGEERWFLVDHAKTDEDSVLTITKDITDHKKADQALRESEERYRSLFEDSRDAIYIITRDGYYIDVNQSFVELSGYTKEEILKLNVLEFYVNPADRLRFQHEIERNGSVRDFEVKFRKKDGTEINSLLSSTVRTDSDGSVLGYQGIVRDITERKKAEEALLESEERYRSIFEASRDMVYIRTKEGNFVDINPAGLKMFGYTKEEMLNLNVMELYVDPADRIKFQQEIERNGAVKNFEVKLRKKDGTEIECLATSTVRLDRDANILGYQGIVRDITESKQEEEKMKRYTKDLERIVDERTGDLKEVQRLLYNIYYKLS